MSPEEWERIRHARRQPLTSKMAVAPHVREIVCSDVSPTMLAEATENLAGFSNASTFLARGSTLRPLQE